MMTVQEVTSAARHGGSTRGLRALVGKLAAGLALAGLAMGASAWEQPNDGVYNDRIDWGISIDMTGTASGQQVPWTRGFQAYMRKVNDAGGINGRKINVMVEDTRYDPTADRTVYEKFVNQTPVLGISGLGSSSAQVALLPTIRSGKVPIIGVYAVTKAGLEPPTPMYYAGYCGPKEMAQVGTNFFSDKHKLTKPKVAIAHMDVAGGKEFADFVSAEAAKRGGVAKAMPIKVGAADVTPQVLEIVDMKPDIVAVYGVPNPTILLMRTMAQYGLKIPTFAIMHLGTPQVYAALGPETGSNYHFVSCFTPGSVDEPSVGIKEMSAAADKYGYAEFKDNINFVGGWVAGQVVADAVARIGPEPTREKLVASMDKGFELDTKGLSSPVKYTKTDKRGLIGLRPYVYDYQTKRFVAFGQYSDYTKFVDPLK
jgi:branched-chain amino acid transport system substrate-binding protein